MIVLIVVLNGFAKSFVISWIDVITIVLAEKAHLLVYMIMYVIMLKYGSLDVLSHRECNFSVSMFLLDQNLCYPSKLSDSGVMSRIMVREARLILIN